MMILGPLSGLSGFPFEGSVLLCILEKWQNMGAMRFLFLKGQKFSPTNIIRVPFSSQLTLFCKCGGLQENTLTAGANSLMSVCNTLEQYSIANFFYKLMSKNASFKIT